MAKSRSANYDYRQTGIADCGHVTRLWPQFHHLGEQYVEVLCDDCTRALRGLPAFKCDPEDLVYVRVSKPDEPKPKPRKAAKKQVRCSMCQQKGHTYESCPLLVGQGTLFDG